MNTNRLTHPGNLLLAGFGLLLLMMGSLVYLSMRQNVSLVNTNYYQQELVYQQRLDAMNNTAAMDSSFQISTRGRQIILDLPATLSSTIEAGSLVLYCPSDESLDRSFVLMPQQSGVYVFDMQQPLRKRCIAKISFTAAGKQYYKEMPLAQQ